MTQREIDQAASIIRPGAREVPHAPEPDYREPLTPLDALLGGERRAKAICVFVALALVVGLAVML